VATAYSSTEVTLLFPQDDGHKFSLSKVLPSLADLLGCAGCTTLYIVIDQDSPRYASIGSIDSDYSNEGSARLGSSYDSRTKNQSFFGLLRLHASLRAGALQATRHRWLTDIWPFKCSYQRLAICTATICLESAHMPMERRRPHTNSDDFARFAFVSISLPLQELLRNDLHDYN